MFAGAAREAVFANPEVARRIQNDFVPVALKAAMVANPPPGLEGRLYREFRRTQPAPQGICVANSAGKVLDWALSFDDESSVVDFLDHCLRRYAQFPDAQAPAAAQRYMRFPSHQLTDVPDNGQVVSIPERHEPNELCPARPRYQPGSLLGLVVGRALDQEGKPVADTKSQEHYVEDRFEVPVPVQQSLASVIQRAGNDRFQLPDPLPRLLVSTAYLGQLDVNPLGGPSTGGRTDQRRWEFWARKEGGQPQGTVRLWIEGNSFVAGAQAARGSRTDGRLWQHSVKLQWEGFVDLEGPRMTSMVFTARGSERLTWGNKRGWLDQRPDVAHLPAGRPIDLACDVQYGLVAEPLPEDQSARAGTRPSARSLPSDPGQIVDVPPTAETLVRRIDNLQRRLEVLATRLDRLESAVRGRERESSRRER